MTNPPTPELLRLTTVEQAARDQLARMRQSVSDPHVLQAAREIWLEAVASLRAYVKANLN